jgi:hypothetical protein
MVEKDIPEPRPRQVQDMLSFSVLSGVRSMNQIFPLESAADAFDLMMATHDLEQSSRTSCLYTFNAAHSLDRWNKFKRETFTYVSS